MSNRVYYFENTTLNHNTGKHHSKFYRMIELGNGKFLVEWGSIGKNPLGTKEYSMGEWYNIQTKKENKGYVFGNDPGNTTYQPQPVQSPQPVEPKYDTKKVSAIKLKIRMVVELLSEIDIPELEENAFQVNKQRVQGIYANFCDDPGTFTQEKAKELNEIYNKYRVDKN